MGVRHKKAIRAFSSFLLGLILFPAATWGQASKDFYPQVRAPHPRPAVGEAYTFSLGLLISAQVPTYNPFAQDQSTSYEAFRFQTPTSFGLEAAFALTSWWEIGASAEISSFESRFRAQNGDVSRIDSIQYRAFPIAKGLSRFRYTLSPGVALEGELGAGMAFGKITVSSTDQGTVPLHNKIRSFAGHAGAGLGMSWQDGYSTHLLLGYSLITLGDNLYQSSAFDIIQAGSFSGPYFKAQLRIQF